MSAKFEWQTDDDAEWQEPLPPTAVPRRRFPWRWALLTLLLVLLGGFWVLQQIEARVAQATAVVEADVRSSHALWQQAMAASDVELLNALRSGRDPGWLQGQRALEELDLLVGRWPLGLEPTGNVTEVDVRLAPDLTAAEVEVARTYRALSDEVTLHQTYVYRQGGQRWLHAPPDDNFWGVWRTLESQALTLSVPERDAQLARRLLTDLQAEVTRACDQLSDLNCPADLHFSVYFDTDPNSLAEAADPTATLRQPGEIGLRLPTPTLVGLPQDAIGYQALLRGYAIHVVAAAITESVGWRCCRQGLFYQALLDWQLAQLGLQPWPLDEPAYAEMFRGPILGVFNMNDLWIRPPVAPAGRDAPVLQVYSIIAYLLAEEGHSAVAMQRRLSDAATYWGWIQAYVNPNTCLEARQAWLRHAGQQIAAPPPTSLPKQDIQLLCEPDQGQVTTLLRYDPRRGNFTEEMSGRVFNFMHPLPDDSGVVLQEQEGRFWESQLWVWRNGRLAPIAPIPFDALLYQAANYADNLVLHAFDARYRRPELYLFEPSRCKEADCGLQPLPGVPVWSPDAQAVLYAAEDGRIWLSDDVGAQRTVAERATLPFWINANQYGYVRLQGDRPAIHLRTRTPDAPLETIPLATFLPYLPPSMAPDNLETHDILPYPADGQRLFILLSERRRANRAGGALLLNYDLENQSVQVMHRIEDSLSRFDPLTLSPDGRWLVIRSLALTARHAQIVLYDLHTGRTYQLNSFTASGNPGTDWSADGHWLLRIEDGYIVLLAPETGHQTLLAENCSYAAWIGRSG